MENKNRTILSLDLGSDLGWSYIENNLIKATGTVLLNKRNGEPDGPKFIRFYDWIQDWNGVDEIFFEDVRRYMSCQAARTWCGFFAVLMMFTASTRIRTTGIVTPKWKALFTGHGHSDKAAVCAECHKRGWQGGKEGTELNSDEADSIGVAYAVMIARGQQIKFDYSDR